MSSKDGLKVNIRNAFNVVENTYKNLDKLMKYMDSAAEDNNFVSLTPRFLRWRSDADYAGWYPKSFIKLYQKKSDRELPNKSELRNGPIYAVEFNFMEDPIVNISKLVYNDIKSWSGISVSEHWRFYYPINGEDEFNFESLDDEYYKSTPKDDKIAEHYWNFNHAIYKPISLVDITSENVKKLIFDEFEKYSDWKPEGPDASSHQYLIETYFIPLVD